VDYLFTPVNFADGAFKRYLSKKPGDGGLSPGKLVFKEEFDQFTEEAYDQVRDRITQGKPPVTLNIGGPSIVSLIHAAQMLHGLAAQVEFYGGKGNDKGSTFIEEKLAQTPLKIGHYRTAGQRTPSTDVLSDPDSDNGHGERIFINTIGAAWEFKPADLDDSFFASDMVEFGGTALVPQIHTALGELLQKAKARKAITVVNTVYDFLNENKNPSEPWPLGQSPETYRHIDLLITDMEEALRLSGTDSVDAAIDVFKSTGVGAVIITHGSHALHFFSDSALFGRISRASLPVSDRVKLQLSQHPEQAGDTTGCGDNFVGGVIASITKQQLADPTKVVSLTEAIALGVASGGFACFYHGGTYYEAFPGQKAEQVAPYCQDYLRQVGV
jgi:sugar/nucleoside kinase (ribokinase family)